MALDLAPLNRYPMQPALAGRSGLGCGICPVGGRCDKQSLSYMGDYHLLSLLP